MKEFPPSLKSENQIGQKVPDMSYQLVMERDELSAYVSEVFPQSDHYGFEIETLSPGSIEVSMKVADHHLRPGGTVSGPTMFALADCSSYLLLLAHIGKVALAVTTNLNINFVSKPEGDLMARTRFLKLGKRLAVIDIAICARDEDRLVAHATTTYSIPPNR